MAGGVTATCQIELRRTIDAVGVPPKSTWRVEVKKQSLWTVTDVTPSLPPVAGNTTCNYGDHRTLVALDGSCRQGRRTHSQHHLGIRQRFGENYTCPKWSPAESSTAPDASSPSTCSASVFMFTRPEQSAEKV